MYINLDMTENYNRKYPTKRGFAGINNSFLLFLRVLLFLRELRVRFFIALDIGSNPALHELDGRFRSAGTVRAFEFEIVPVFGAQPEIRAPQERQGSREGGCRCPNMTGANVPIIQLSFRVWE